MGIVVEFNPDLALRDISEHKSGKRKIQECVPENLKVGEVFEFLKKGQRLYWLSDSEFWGGGQIPLCKTGGDEKLSRPIASIKILEATHFLKNGEIWTKGKYRVVDVFDENDPKINFESLRRVI
ncbi:MAG: hypothetical protein M0P97_02570 [Candidatus Moranbacteria bacterium]|jgi:hypothetical protein|nr:hypothetical protein [Candidatus Moranbacteria bacterium]